MRYEHIYKGTFLKRPNRFIAFVQINREGKEQETVVCHVKNTGRCRELLIPGVTVFVQFHPQAAALGRKTEYSLISVWKERNNGSLLINMDSQAPNQVAYEWLQSVSQNPPLPLHTIDENQARFISSIRREVTYGQSRFDLAFRIIVPGNGREDQQEIPAFMEVKGVTLEEDGLAMFPDAPTERGVKHMMELINALRDGYEAYLLFVIQMKEIKTFTPNSKMHPEFAQVLMEAAEAGVHILAYDCAVTENTLCINEPVPVFTQYTT